MFFFLMVMSRDMLLLSHCIILDGLHTQKKRGSCFGWESKPEIQRELFPKKKIRRDLLVLVVNLGEKRCCDDFPNLEIQ